MGELRGFCSAHNDTSEGTGNDEKANNCVCMYVVISTYMHDDRAYVCSTMVCMRCIHALQCATALEYVRTRMFCVIQGTFMRTVLGPDARLNTTTYTHACKTRQIMPATSHGDRVKDAVDGVVNRREVAQSVRVHQRLEKKRTNASTFRTKAMLVMSVDANSQLKRLPSAHTTFHQKHTRRQTAQPGSPLQSSRLGSVSRVARCTLPSSSGCCGRCPRFQHHHFPLQLQCVPESS